MNSNFSRVGIAAIAIVTSMINTVGIAQAQLIKIQPNPNNPINSINPKIDNLKLAPSVSGNLELAVGKYGYKAECKNVKVYLISEEYTETPASSSSESINLPTKKYLFQHTGVAKADKTKNNSGSTTYCTYSVAFKSQFIGKNARLVIDSGSVCPSDETLNLNNEYIKKDIKNYICGIG